MTRDWAAVPYTRGNGAQVDGELDFPHFIEFTESLSELPFVYVNHLCDLNPDKVSKWWATIKAGGYLVFSAQYEPALLCSVMEDIGSWDLVENKGCSVFKKIESGNTLSCIGGAQPFRTACVVRYGGFGDMIQTASVLPQLKKQGYRVTVMCTPKGHDILKHDPHIDEFLIQDHDQVPNPELAGYWGYWREQFDKFINLSMTWEGLLLVMEHDFRTHWPKEAIHTLCNYNYMEITAKIAGVGFKPDTAKFYPSPEEEAWATKELEPLADKTVILWSLSGSSIHKMTPFADSVIARILTTYKNAHIILVGDDLCKVLEVGWEEEDRVWKKSGEYTIRETLTLALNADIVVGPQTGVMMAAGMEPVRKVLMLSHSTKENLSKHWKNCTTLIPKNTPCYPCHKIHYGWGTCQRKTVEYMGEPLEHVLCCLELDQDKIYSAIRNHLIQLERKHGHVRHQDIQLHTE